MLTSNGDGRMSATNPAGAGAVPGNGSPSSSQMFPRAQESSPGVPDSAIFEIEIDRVKADHNGDHEATPLPAPSPPRPSVRLAHWQKWRGVAGATSMKRDTAEDIFWSWLGAFVGILVAALLHYRVLSPQVWSAAALRYSSPL